MTDTGGLQEIHDDALAARLREFGLPVMHHAQRAFEKRGRRVDGVVDFVLVPRNLRLATKVWLRLPSRADRRRELDVLGDVRREGHQSTLSRLTYYGNG